MAIHIFVPSSMLSQSPLNPEKNSMAIWLGILSIYIFLCSVTGYLSFIKPDHSPGYDKYLEISQLKDKEAQEFLIELLKEEETEHIERNKLASQSFHIILGALLGFMSASAASILRKNTE